MLDAEELRELEATLLPTLERHHLRLLAHGLRTLQAVAGRRGGPIPAAEAIEAWARQQPQISADPGFADAFLTQMGRMAEQLETIAAGSGREPLDLDLADLGAWARDAAERRVRAPADPPGPPPG